MKNIKQKTQKDNIFILILLGVVIFIISFTAYKYNNKKNISDQGDHVAEVKKVIPMRDLNDSDHYRFKNNSNYTAVLYFSMDCVDCRKAESFIDKLQDKYKDKFNLVYRHSPLTRSEPFSAEKAVISECVYRQSGDKGMFDFISDMYKNYKITQTNNDWVIFIAKKYVKDSELLNDCLNGQDAKDLISRYKTEAMIDGVISVPSVGIFNNGKLVARYDNLGGDTLIKILNYLSTFSMNADQFWSDDVFKKISN